MIVRRALAPLLLLPAQAIAAADGPFPPRAEAAGRPLVLNGWGSRRYLGIEVYRAALYLEQPRAEAEAILAAPEAKLLRVHYLREVPLSAVQQAWGESFAATCGCAMPEAFRRWLRPLSPGDEERFLFPPGGGAELAAGIAPPLRLDGGPAARALLAAFIGPAAPTAALRRGLLGQAR